MLSRVNHAPGSKANRRARTKAVSPAGGSCPGRLHRPAQAQPCPEVQGALAQDGTGETVPAGAGQPGRVLQHGGQLHPARRSTQPRVLQWALLSLYLPTVLAPTRLLPAPCGSPLVTLGRLSCPCSGSLCEARGPVGLAEPQSPLLLPAQSQ